MKEAELRRRLKRRLLMDKKMLRCALKMFCKERVLVVSSREMIMQVDSSNSIPVLLNPEVQGKLWRCKQTKLKEERLKMVIR